MKMIAWSVDKNQYADFVLSWWPRGDNYCPRNCVTLGSKNFVEAVEEAKYFLNLDEIN
jgi:hypothetical protein